MVIRRWLNNIAIQINLHQRRSRDFIKHETIGVDQEVMIRARQPQGDMGEDHIVPTVKRDQPIKCSAINARSPFCVIDFFTINWGNAGHHTGKSGCSTCG
jgi:hypothetical protein